MILRNPEQYNTKEAGKICDLSGNILGKFFTRKTGIKSGYMRVYIAFIPLLASLSSAAIKVLPAVLYYFHETYKDNTFVIDIPALCNRDSEWGTSKSTAYAGLQELEKAGLIKKYPVKEGAPLKNMYKMNFNYIAEGRYVMEKW